MYLDFRIRFICGKTNCDENLRGNNVARRNIPRRNSRSEISNGELSHVEFSRGTKKNNVDIYIFILEVKMSH